MIKAWIPPAIMQGYRGLRSDVIRFQGEFSTWASARAASSGYDSEAIFQKARAAALKVKKGEVVYERDSVLFDHVEFSYREAVGSFGRRFFLPRDISNIFTDTFRKKHDMRQDFSDAKGDGTLVVDTTNAGG
ncbi:MAG: hypothetical protein LKG23_10655 [Nitrospira sp.]|nr:hypothetical protein [Nitrospira sp.]